MKTYGLLFTASKVVRNIWTFVIIFLMTMFLLLLFIRVIWGPGQNNPVYEATGIYVGKAIYFTVYFIGFLLLLNKRFWKTVVRHFSSSRYLTDTNFLERKDRSWIYTCLASFIGFIALTGLYFRNKSENVFIGVDGDYLRSVNFNQENWGGNSFNLGINPLQGLGGNIWFPLNTRSDPGYLLGRVPENFNFVLAHIGWATILYLSTFMLATRLKLMKEAVILAAWIVPFLIIYPSVLQFSTVPQLIPHLSSVIALNTFILAALITIQNTIRSSITSGLLFIACITCILIINPSFLILCIPVNLIVFIVSLRTHFRNGLTTRFLLTFGIPSILLLIPTASYLLGIFKYSAVGRYPDQFIVGTKSNRSISSIFQLPGTATIIFVSLIGMFLLSRFHKNKEIAALAKSIIILFCFLLCFGFFYVRKPEIWDGPSPNYFEFMIWPLYGIFFSIVLVVLLSGTINAAKKRMNLLSKVSETNILLSMILAFALMASFVAIPGQKNWEFPAKGNKILDQLEELAISPGNEFRGRVMTFTGLNLPEGISWNDLQKNDYVPIISDFGTDFRKADLWIRSIPTLTEYSQTISPISYSLLLASLGKKGDYQVRNIMTLRRVNPSALALLGVALIVTDKKIEGLELIETLKSKTYSIYLYKISEPNLEGYSPIQVVTYKSKESILDRMSKMNFDPKKVVFVSDDLEVTNLQVAFDTEFQVLRNGYGVKATSSGNSILILPIEFSSCWSVVSNKSSKDTPKLFRANYGLTGLLFSNSMNVELVYKYNFFGNQSCRLTDLTKTK
jgi:hypothetical protein